MHTPPPTSDSLPPSDDAAPGPGLPPGTRRCIVLLGLLQGVLWYGAHQAHSRGWGPWAQLGVYGAWVAWVLALPTVVALSVVRLRDALFWRGTGALAALVLALAAWAGWNATGAPGTASSVWAPLGLALGLLLLVALPWWQCRLQHRRWHAPYPDLFAYAWHNALALALAALFTGLCWGVLGLWAGLFTLVKVPLFADLFAQPAFIALASGTMAGVGVLIGRTQQRAVQTARQSLLALCQALLPLLALAVVLFVLSLPFTGLQPLWQTRKAAAVLLGVLALQVVFVNAVYQDGRHARAATRSSGPYPPLLRRLVEASLLAMPVLAGLALTALGLRINQYGWTTDRLWALWLALVLSAYAGGYALAALRPRSAWLERLEPVNRYTSWLVMALAVLVHTPLLDPFRIAAHSQTERLRAASAPAPEADLVALRFDHGRHGHAALQSLQDAPAYQSAPAQRLLQGVLARPQRWQHQPSTEALRSGAVTTAAQAQRLIAPASGHPLPDADWWQALLAQHLRGMECLQSGADCVVLQADLDGDGQPEQVLCELSARWGTPCTLSTRQDGRWQHAGQVDWQTRSTDTQALHQHLRAGQLQAQQPRWQELQVQGQRGRIRADPSD